MKSFKKMTSALLVASALVVTGCEPDPVENTNDVLHTTWINTYTETYEDENGVTQEYRETYTLAFMTETTGLTSYQFTDTEGTETDSLPFTYTYTRPNGTMTVAEGDIDTIQFNFTYNAGNKTLTLVAEGDSMVFTKR